MKKLLILLLIPAAVQANGLTCITWTGPDKQPKTLCCDAYGICF